MQYTIHEINNLLTNKKRPIRRVNDYDLILIKNELINLLSSHPNIEEQQYIRKLINELHLLKITVERDDDDAIVFGYNPPTKFNRRLSLYESGWITISK